MNIQNSKATKFSISFGADIQGQSTVDAIAFQGFLADIVTPRFPAFTLIEASGYWQGKPEQTRILEIIVPLVDGATSYKTRLTVHKIARAYAIRFRQDCVLVTEQEVESAFVEQPTLLTEQRDAQDFATI